MSSLESFRIYMTAVHFLATKELFLNVSEWISGDTGTILNHPVIVWLFRVIGSEERNDCLSYCGGAPPAPRPEVGVIFSLQSARMSSLPSPHVTMKISLQPRRTCVKQCRHGL